MKINRSYRTNMTLLDATSTLIDAARAHCPSNPHLDRAIHRMEQRLEILRARKVKANERAYWKAWDHFVDLEQGPRHRACGELINPTTFFEIVEITPGGRIKSLLCPHCEKVIV